jgi:hypothetical protein
VEFLDSSPSLQHKLASTNVVIGYRRWAEGMADYYALISYAIAAFDKKTSEARRVFYDRARAILVDRLRNADPPLSETVIEHERLALEDAISKVEADAIASEGTLPIPNGLQTQSDHTEDYIRSATVEASSAQPDAKLQRQRRLAFCGFLILYALWIGDLFYKPPTFSDWYEWLRLGGVIFFLALTILSCFIMLKNWSAEQEERAYIVLAPIILVGTVLVSAALYFTFGWLAATPS